MALLYVQTTDRLTLNRGLREYTGRDQQIVTSRIRANFCVTYNTQYKDNYVFISMRKTEYCLKKNTYYDKKKTINRAFHIT
jgi:hypothetical protein